ncbi:unnamed protein product [Ilex paraguariensis]|uniref:Uncharacterized protein n=1 Tax=Ilex paraguariensis TaxID=185542 RepID=A0ABC8SAQ1_9AQUA
MQLVIGLANVVITILCTSSVYAWIKTPLRTDSWIDSGEVLDLVGFGSPSVRPQLPRMILVKYEMSCGPEAHW